MPQLDFTINIPTLAIIFGIGLRVYSRMARTAHKIDTMWTQFLIDHPEYERRETLGRSLR